MNGITLNRSSEPDLAAVSAAPSSPRLMSLDAFRGAIMLLMALSGFGVPQVGLCPIVKRISTPSWAIFSAGWVALLLAGMVAVIEWRGWRSWAFPLVVAGLNPITLYCMWQLTGGFVRDSLKIHLGQGIFTILGDAYAPMVEQTSVLIVFWIILFWLYRRRIFLRL